MSSGKDYYSILGVDRNASKDEITKAYRKAALRYHPDRQQGKSDAEKKEAEEKFKECSEAASVLTDDAKRAQYDRFGSTQGAGGGNGFDPFDYFRKFHQGFGGMGFGSDMFRGFGFDPGFDFGGMPGYRQKRDPNAPTDGEDIAIGITIDFSLALYGGTSEFEIDVEDPCPKCGGTGAKDGNLKPCHVCGGTGMETVRNGIMVMSTTCRACHGNGTEPGEPCPECKGSGTVSSERKIKVAIVPGTNSGHRLLVSGEGRKGLRGGKPGNLIVEVHVAGNSPYGRDGMDLKTMLPISPITATIGGTVQVETPWGTESVTINRGTRSGTVLKIPGHGVRKGDSRGDLVLTVLISSLTNLTEEQEKILKKLSKSLSDRNVAVLEESNEAKREFRRHKP